MNSLRIIDRKLLASFIEYAVEGKVTSLEWNRFIIEHYQDSMMESARSRCAQLLGGYGENPPESIEVKNELHKLAKELRENT